MALDQTPSPAATESLAPPAIDNEFPTYRAISSLAVFSLVFGLASVFSFASLWFLLLAGAAVVSGWMALRKISRFPEILTGASYARVGIGVALLFGLSSITNYVAEEILTTVDAQRFAQHYIEIIKDQPVGLALWYEQGLEYRKVKTPDDVVEEIKKSKNPGTEDPYGQKTAGFVAIKNRLKSSGQELRFSKIESKIVHGITIYANALIEVDGPVTATYPKKQYGLIMMSKAPGVGKYDWVVQDFKFPYTPESVGVEVPHADDDGHGH